MADSIKTEPFYINQWTSVVYLNTTDATQKYMHTKLIMHIHNAS
jgi:hypothetical protein